MTTSTLQLTITCPDWCTIDPQEHANELWNSGGSCIHHSSTILVEDHSRGPGVGSLDESRPERPAEVSFSTQTTPDNREDASPCFWVNDREYSIEQITALAMAITEAVELYRTNGGVA